jgi:sec-independent protein translocase protein TatC
MVTRKENPVSTPPADNFTSSPNTPADSTPSPATVAPAAVTPPVASATPTSAIKPASTPKITPPKQPTTQSAAPSPTPNKPVVISEVQDVGARMSILDHLDELRRRLTYAALGLLFGTVLAAFIATPTMEFLIRPYGDLLTALSPTDPIIAFFRVSLTLGGALALPLITYQLLMFIFPGLEDHEKRFILRALPAVVVLFILGVVFAWAILIPPAINFLTGFQPTLFRAQWTADLYLSFVTSLLFWMGVSFQTPLIFFVMSLLGAVNAGQLRQNWRIAIVCASIIAALITPTVDPVNMALVMVPLLTLYTLSIGLVALGARLRRPKDAA